MTIFLVIIIIGCFSLCGYKIALYYINRKNFFKNLKLFMNSIKLDVGFSQEKLFFIIKKNIEKFKCVWLSSLCREYMQFLEIREKVDVSIFKNITFLKLEEKNNILMFFNSLGRYDSSSQIKEIENYIVIIEKYSAVAEDECKKYASLYIKLSIIVGVMICLLII